MDAHAPEMLMFMILVNSSLFSVRATAIMFMMRSRVVCCFAPRSKLGAHSQSIFRHHAGDLQTKTNKCLTLITSGVELRSLSTKLWSCISCVA